MRNLALIYAAAVVGCGILCQYTLALRYGPHRWQWRAGVRFAQTLATGQATVFLLLSPLWRPLQYEFLVLGLVSIVVALIMRLLLVDWLLIWWKAQAGRFPWDNLPPPPGAPAY